MTNGFRETKVEGHTVRELALGQIMDLREEFPDGGNKMTMALIGEAVIGEDGKPIGRQAARKLPGHLINGFSKAVTELHGWGEEEGAEKNVGSQLPS